MDTNPTALPRLIKRKSHSKAAGFLLLSFAALNFVFTEGVDNFTTYLQKSHTTTTVVLTHVLTHVPVKPAVKQVQHYKKWVYPKIGGGSYTLKVPASELRMWGLPVHPVPHHMGTATVLPAKGISNTLGLPRSDIRMAGFATSRTGAGSGYGGRPYFKPHRPLHLEKPARATAQPSHPVQPLVVFPALPKPATPKTIEVLPASIKAAHIENGYGYTIDETLAVLAFLAYLIGALIGENIIEVEKITS
jgi:hypothetical protein